VTLWSKLETAVPQEGEAEFGVLSDAIESLVGKDSSLVDGVGA
jgi:hypothetical protein